MWNSCDSSSPTDISAGNAAVVDISSGDTIRILWEKDDDSASLSVWDGPDA